MIAPMLAYLQLFLVWLWRTYMQISAIVLDCSRPHGGTLLLLEYIR